MVGYVLNARDKPGLLVAFMKELAGNARMSFEGDLSRCDFSGLANAQLEPDGVFQRNTVSPRQDYVIVPLTQETLQPIMAQVLPGARCIHDIVHIQIEKDGKLAFSACDSFHPHCTWAPLSARGLLEKLKRRGIVRSYEMWAGSDNAR
jgi:hypothetical protein